MTDECKNEQSDYRIDLSRLPIKLMDRSSSTVGANMLIVGVLLVGLPGMGLAGGVMSGEYHWAHLLAAVGVLAGVGLFIAGLRLFSRRITTVITDQGVTKETKSVFGSSQWSEPLSGYEGILSEVEQMPTPDSAGKKGETHTVWSVSLYHGDAEKCVLLYAARSDAGVAAYVEVATAAFGVPAVPAGDDETTEASQRDVPSGR